MIHVFILFAYCIINCNCEEILYNQYNGNCTGGTITRFTTFATLTCVRECLNTCTCTAFNEHEDDATSPGSTCELLEYAVLEQGVEDSQLDPSSTCFSE